MMCTRLEMSWPKPTTILPDALVTNYDAIRRKFLTNRRRRWPTLR
jgi:hypothetical protein